MSVQQDHRDHHETSEVNSSQCANGSTNWTIHVSDVKTIKVSNVSQSAYQKDIKDFFSYCGDIQYVEMQRESEQTQVAYVTFKESQGADAAILLSGAIISNSPITITPSEDYQLPPEAQPPNPSKEPSSNYAVQKAEDMVSTMLASGCVLGKDALNKARAFDEQHHWTSNATAAITSIDRKIGLSDKLSMGTTVISDKMREMDEKFKVLEKTRSALILAEGTASNVGSVIKRNKYTSFGASWVSIAFGAVVKVAHGVRVMTKEKVQKAEEDRKGSLILCMNQKD